MKELRFFKVSCWLTPLVLTSTCIMDISRPENSNLSGTTFVIGEHVYKILDLDP